jgi:hypothetical protein
MKRKLLMVLIYAVIILGVPKLILLLKPWLLKHWEFTAVLMIVFMIMPVLAVILLLNKQK